MAHGGDFHICYTSLDSLWCLWPCLLWVYLGKTMKDVKIRLQSSPTFPVWLSFSFFIPHLIPTLLYCKGPGASWMGTKWCSTQGCFPGPTNPSLNCWECQLRKAPNSIPHWNITSASGNDLTQCNAHSQEAAHNQWLANNGIQTSGSLASTGNSEGPSHL